jgi:hypothetical protein
MTWKPLVSRLKRVTSQPDSVLLLELASGALLLAWVAHWVAE